jgi:hypothetical protein
VVFSSGREGEEGSIPGVGLMPFYVLDVHRGEIVGDLGDFTDAGLYFGPRFTATPALLAPRETLPLDAEGNAIVPPQGDPRTDDDHSSLELHRVILPAANDLPFKLAASPPWAN